MTRVLIAEDEPLMRERLAAMLAACYAAILLFGVYARRSQHA